MTGAQFGTFILGLIVVAIVVAIVVWLLHWLYLRSSKERAFVRTGLGGQKVVLDGGALVLPIVHEVIPVNMNTLRLEVSRGRDKALITKDRMRVDVIAEFYVRVAAEPSAVAAAAQTLGLRTLRARAAEGAGRGQVRRRAAHRRRRDDDGRAARKARQLRQARARHRGRRSDQERPGARVGLADAARPDRDGVLQPEQRVRRRGPDAADRADRAPQEAAQRRRAGHADRDPQQEPRGRETLARHRSRERIRAPHAAARGRRSRAPRQRAEVATERAQREQDAEQAQITAKQTHRGSTHPQRPERRARAHPEGACGAGGRGGAPPGARAGRAAASDRGGAREQGTERGAGVGRGGARARRVGRREGVHRTRGRDGRAQEGDRPDRRRAGGRARVAAADVSGQGREAWPAPTAARRSARRRRPTPMPTRSSRWPPRCAPRSKPRRHAPDERGAERAVARGARVGVAYASWSRRPTPSSARR